MSGVGNFFFFQMWESIMKKFEQIHTRLHISFLAWMLEIPDVSGWPGLVGPQNNQLPLVSPCPSDLYFLFPWTVARQFALWAVARNVHPRKFFLRAGAILCVTGTARESQQASSTVLYHLSICSFSSFYWLPAVCQAYQRVSDRFLPWVQQRGCGGGPAASSRRRRRMFSASEGEPVPEKREVDQGRVGHRREAYSFKIRWSGRPSVRGWGSRGLTKKDIIKEDTLGSRAPGRGKPRAT